MKNILSLGYLYLTKNKIDMANDFIPLVVLRDGPSTSQAISEDVPTVKLIPSETIESIIPTDFGGSKLGLAGDGGVRKDVLVLENPLQVKAAKDPSASNLHVANEVDATVEAAGSTQGNGTTITKYFNNVTAATGTSAEALDLPAATPGAVHVIVNTTGVALEVFPASGESIDGLAANALKSVPAGESMYFGCVEAGTWVTSTLY